MLNLNDIDAIRAALRGQSVNAPLSQRGAEIVAYLDSIPASERAYRAISFLSKVLSSKELDQLGMSSPFQKVQRLLPASALSQLPAPRWLLENFIPEQALIVVYGESGAGKSFVVLDLALQCSQQHPVVYIPTEGLRGYTKRVEAWTAHRQQGASNLWFYVAPINLMSEADVLMLIENVKALSPKLVVVDTLAMSLVGADENSSRDVGVALSHCRRIIETGASVVLVHHSGKSATVERGSSALRGNADVMLRLTPLDDVVCLEFTKVKDFESPPPRYIRLKECAESLVVVPVCEEEGTRKRLTQSQLKVLEALTLDTASDGITLRELAEITGTAYSTLHRIVSKLMRLELVARDKGGYRITEKGRLIHSDPSRDPSVNAELEPKKGTDPLIHVIHASDQLRLLMDRADQADQRITSAYYRAGL